MITRHRLEVNCPLKLGYDLTDSWAQYVYINGAIWICNSQPLMIVTGNTRMKLTGFFVIVHIILTVQIKCFCEKSVFSISSS